jgi:hypothetical protein
MKQVLIVLLASLSSCTFIQKGQYKKSQIEIESLQFIEMNRSQNDSNALKLTGKQSLDFIYKWNNSKVKGLYKYLPEYFITVHLVNGKTRSFRTNFDKIKEDEDNCYSISDTSYFDKLWNDLLIENSNKEYFKISKDKFPELINKMDSGLSVELIDLYKDSELIPDTDTLYINHYLKNLGFKVTDYGRGNWMQGPRIVSFTLENENYKCYVDKLYYSQDSANKNKITERIKCKKK